jgi:hypothetical protein
MNRPRARRNIRSLGFLTALGGLVVAAPALLWAQAPSTSRPAVPQATLGPMRNTPQAPSTSRPLVLAPAPGPERIIPGPSGGMILTSGGLVSYEAPRFASAGGTRQYTWCVILSATNSSGAPITTMQSQDVRVVFFGFGQIVGGDGRLSGVDTNPSPNCTWAMLPESGVYGLTMHLTETIGPNGAASMPPGPDVFFVRASTTASGTTWSGQTLVNVGAGYGR